MAQTIEVMPMLDPAVLALIPPQGEWSETDYLWLSGRTNRLVELVEGVVEVLPPPTTLHQRVSRDLFFHLFALMQRTGGDVYFAPLRLRIGLRRFREPDLLLVMDIDDPRARNDYWDGADLVVEIVSPDDPDRDYVAKRRDYADAGILEYWIVDPQRTMITVLRLASSVYAEHGVFGAGQQATSALYPDFVVDVAAVMAH